MAPNSHNNLHQLTAHLFRDNAGKMTAVLCRLFGLNQMEQVEDIVQDTFEAALSKWRFSGIPDNPSGWLMQVAKNKALNALKRERRIQSCSVLEHVQLPDTSFENQFNILLSSEEIKDCQLRLLFSCCHPCLSLKNQITLTLHTLCGFGIPEIANALFTREETVRKALARSKKILRESTNTSYEVADTKLHKPSKAVLTILYLMFNEGYKTTRGKKAVNNDLCFEAIRLAKLLDGDVETEALLSLMFFNLSRFPARISAPHEYLTLDEQDRSQWDRVFIEEGYYYLKKATRYKTITRFHIEAIIASLHCSASTFEETDWKKIAYLYRLLEAIEPSSPLVKLNRIIAESYIPTTRSIEELDELETHPSLKDGFLIQAAKGDVYRRRGYNHEALKAYKRAFDRAISPFDRRFLEKRISTIKCTLYSPQGK